MGDGFRQLPREGRATSDAPTAADPTFASADEHDRSWPLADPMRLVRRERALAGAQLGRSLKAWRKASGSNAGPAVIPQGGGSPLSGEVRARMEPKLGADLSGVRVHTSNESVAAADSLGARAFTVASDVHFNAGQFAPGSKEGDKLLAHELTHVVQGQKAGVQRAASDADAAENDGASNVSHPSDPAEKEADAAGEHVADALHGGGTPQQDEPGAKPTAAPASGAHAAPAAVSRKPMPEISAAPPARAIMRSVQVDANIASAVIDDADVNHTGALDWVNANRAGGLQINQHTYDKLVAKWGKDKIKELETKYGITVLATAEKDLAAAAARIEAAFKGTDRVISAEDARVAATALIKGEKLSTNDLQFFKRAKDLGLNAEYVGSGDAKKKADAYAPRIVKIPPP